MASSSSKLKTWDEVGFNRPIIRESIARACQCQPGTYQPNCRVQDTCPTTGRPVQLYFAPGVDHSTVQSIYFGTGDEVYSDMYAISTNEYEHDSGDKSDLSLPLY